MGKACPFSSSAIQNLIIIAFFKMMLLRDSLVYDSENWTAYQPFLVVSLLFVFETYRSCHIRNKGAY